MNLSGIRVLEETVERQPSGEYPSLDPDRLRISSFSQGLFWDRSETDRLFSLSCWQSAEARDGFFQPEMEFDRTRGSAQKLEIKV